MFSSQILVWGTELKQNIITWALKGDENLTYLLYTIPNWIRFVRKFSFQKNVNNLKKRNFRSRILTQISAFNVFVAWIKLFKYLSFNKTMTQLSGTLSAVRISCCLTFFKSAMSNQISLLATLVPCVSGIVTRVASLLSQLACVFRQKYRTEKYLLHH
jgi:hypothetical protein